jgi:hypothetical protein
MGFEKIFRMMDFDFICMLSLKNHQGLPMFAFYLIYKIITQFVKRIFCRRQMKNTYIDYGNRDSGLFIFLPFLGI